MFTKEGIRAMHCWTYDSLDIVLGCAAAMPPELFTQQVPGFGHATIRDQLVHVLSCEATWVEGLQNISPCGLSSADYPDVESVRTARRCVAEATLAYIDRLTVEQLNAPVESTPPEWLGPKQTPAYILHHILTHAFHHKGQMGVMFRALGYPLPDTDLQRAN